MIVVQIHVDGLIGVFRDGVFHADFGGSVVVVFGVASSSVFSCLTGGSSDPSFELPSFGLSTSSTSIFLLLPLGAGSSGVRQYVTVRVTTCRTLTLPGLLLASLGSTSRGEKDALQGAALSGVDE